MNLRYQIFILSFNVSLYIIFKTNLLFFFYIYMEFFLKELTKRSFVNLKKYIVLADLNVCRFDSLV